MLRNASSLRLSITSCNASFLPSSSSPSSICSPSPIHLSPFPISFLPLPDIPSLFLIFPLTFQHFSFVHSYIVFLLCLVFRTSSLSLSLSLSLSYILSLYVILFFPCFYHSFYPSPLPMPFSARLPFRVHRGGRDYSREEIDNSTASRKTALNSPRRQGTENRVPPYWEFNEKSRGFGYWLKGFMLSFTLSLFGVA